MASEEENSNGEGSKGKWVGVRLSKVMMEQIKETVDSHPEWAWRNPQDFVRDAVRRHMEYIREQDRFSRRKISDIPGKVDSIAKEMLDGDIYSEFRKKMSAVVSNVDSGKDPKLFLNTMEDVLAEYVGETLASDVLKRLYDSLGGVGSV